MPPTTRANGAHAKLKTKPFLRGVSHTFAAVASLAAGAMLTADTPAGPARLGSAIYTASLTIMFTISSIYHRPTWGLAGRARMRKLGKSFRPRRQDATLSLPHTASLPFPF
jgi:hemolysin III